MKSEGIQCAASVRQEGKALSRKSAGDAAARREKSKSGDVTLLALQLPLQPLYCRMAASCCGSVEHMVVDTSSSGRSVVMLYGDLQFFACVDIRYSCNRRRFGLRLPPRTLETRRLARQTKIRTSHYIEPRTIHDIASHCPHRQCSALCLQHRSHFSAFVCPSLDVTSCD